MSVYFATCGPYTKIGYSANPVTRMTTVTRNGKRPPGVDFGADADLVGWIPGDRSREAELHKRFADQRVAGCEWFVLDPDVVLDLIEADPHGIDIERMSAMAVLLAIKHPHLSREEMAAMGVPLACSSEDVVHNLLSAVDSEAAAS